MDHETVRELTAAYALDALDSDEEREFEEHLAHCAECRAELAAFQEVAAVLAHDVDAPAPPEALRERILVQARSERPNVVSLRRRWVLPAAGAIAAAAACAAIGLGIWAASLSGKLDSEREARAVAAQLVAILADPRLQRVPVSGADGTLVVARDGQAALLISGLERAPAGKAYEAWVIEDGKPRPAGTFAGGGERTAVPIEGRVPAGAVVAVTIEDEGGVEQPTGDPIFSAETL